MKIKTEDITLSFDKVCSIEIGAIYGGSGEYKRELKIYEQGRALNARKVIRLELQGEAEGSLKIEQRTTVRF